MLRVVVETCDAGMAANVGGRVDCSVRTFDIEAPELEAYLREFTDAGKQGQMYWHRRAVGVEVLPNKEGG